MGENVSLIDGHIDNEPRDLVEVVRCKDCKWYGIDREKGGFCMRTSSPSMWRNETGELKPTDFCSYGERRGKEE